MRILFLTQIIPYPPDAGPRVKTWHVIRYLVGKGHNVTLASFIRPEEEQFVPKVEEVCDQVFAVPIRRSRIADVGYWVRSNFTGRPFLVERDNLKEMRNLVMRLVASGEIDAIHADQLTMAQFAFKPKDVSSWPMTVFDAHNAVWKIVERTKESSQFLLKPFLKLETDRIRDFEGIIVCEFDHTLAVSEIDAHALKEALPDIPNYEEQCSKIVTIVPIAVDTDQLRPANRNLDSKNILTMGTLHYPPNADGIRWFANEVFPKIIQEIPEATFTIIGKNPPSDFIQLAKENPEQINVTGYVPDLNPFFDNCAMLVVPVRIGGGIRVRILEGFARATPIVTTTVGLEGINARPGTDVLVEDNANSFANAAIKLLTNKELQNQLAQNGRRIAVTRYEWKTILSELDRIYN